MAAEHPNAFKPQPFSFFTTVTPGVIKTHINNGKQHADNKMQFFQKNTLNSPRLLEDLGLIQCRRLPC